MAQFESLLSQLDRDPHWTPERCAAFELIQNFLSGPLVLLIRKKNEVLFPALEGLFPLRDGPLAVLQEEHKALMAHFGEVRLAGESLNRGDNKVIALRALSTSGRKGMELLNDHLYKEEKVLFPMVARYLTPERDEELLRRMESLGPLLAPHRGTDR